MLAQRGRRGVGVDLHTILSELEGEFILEALYIASLTSVRTHLSAFHRSMTELIDPVFSVHQIALLCVHTNTSIRPSMRQIAIMLSNQLDVPPLPTRPMTLYTLATMASSSSGSASMLRPGQESPSRGSESFTRNIEMQKGAFLSTSP
jgi:hypothetical protein